MTDKLERLRVELHERRREREEAERLWKRDLSYARWRALEAARIRAQNARYALQTAEEGVG